MEANTKKWYLFGRKLTPPLTKPVGFQTECISHITCLDAVNTEELPEKGQPLKENKPMEKAKENIWRKTNINFIIKFF